MPLVYRSLGDRKGLRGREDEEGTSRRVGTAHQWLADAQIHGGQCPPYRSNACRSAVASSSIALRAASITPAIWAKPWIIPG